MSNGFPVLAQVGNGEERPAGIVGPQRTATGVCFELDARRGMIEIPGEAMKPSYTHGVSDVPLIGETIGDWLDDIAAEHADNEALVSVFEHQRFTYGQFLDEVNRCARALMGLDVQKGDRVGIWSTNCVAYQPSSTGSTLPRAETRRGTG